MDKHERVLEEYMEWHEIYGLRYVTELRRRVIALTVYKRACMCVSLFIVERLGKLPESPQRGVQPRHSSIRASRVSAIRCQMGVPEGKTQAR